MKKLYFLNEEEKQRILRLHKSHQIGKQQLHEIAPLIIGGVVAAVAIGTAVADWWNNGVDTEKSEVLIKKVNEGCKAAKIREYINANKNTEFGAIARKNMNTLTDALGAVGSKTNWVTYKEAGIIRSTFEAIPNVPQLCLTLDLYSERTGGEDLLTSIRNQYYYETAYIKDIKIPIQQIVDRQMDIEEKVKSKDTTDTDDTEETIDPVTGEKKKKKKVPGVEPVTHTAESITSEFEKTFPCLAGIVAATKDYKGVYVLNPSDHENIVELPSGYQTKVTERMIFRNNGKYYLKSKRGQPAGAWQCDEASQEDVELTPSSAGLGVPGGLISAFPCLVDYNVIEDKDDPTMGEMSDDSRAKHNELSTYPKGRIIFYKNGTFVTEFDLNSNRKTSGNFSCGGYKNASLQISKKEKASWDEKQRALEPEYRYPDPERPKNRMSGMGIVSASSSYITEILKCAKIGGSTLDQTALNKLYDYIKNNK